VLVLLTTVLDLLMELAHCHLLRLTLSVGDSLLAVTLPWLVLGFGLAGVTVWWEVDTVAV